MEGKKHKILEINETSRLAKSIHVAQMNLHYGCHLVRTQKWDDPFKFSKVIIVWNSNYTASQQIHLLRDSSFSGVQNNGCIISIFTFHRSYSQPQKIYKRSRRLQHPYSNITGQETQFDAWPAQLDSHSHLYTGIFRHLYYFISICFPPFSAWG